jgi:nitrogen fixation protein NifU and related proteins
MKPYYSKKTIKRFTNPKNFGELKNANAIGRVGNPRCGDLMKLYLEVEKKSGKHKIKNVKFHTLGCAAAIATSDIACDLIKGKTLKQALKIDYKKITKELGGLPLVKIHCSVLAKQAIAAAVTDYQKKLEKIKLKDGKKTKKKN